jgi:hypothetical protein
MLEQLIYVYGGEIIRSFQGELSSILMQITGISYEQVVNSLDITRSIMEEDLRNEISRGNTSALYSMLKQKKITADNPILSAITLQCQRRLAGKLGLAESASGAIATFVVAFVMSQLQYVTETGSVDKVISKLSGQG